MVTPLANFGKRFYYLKINQYNTYMDKQNNNDKHMNFISMIQTKQLRYKQRN